MTHDAPRHGRIPVLALTGLALAFALPTAARAQPPAAAESPVALERLTAERFEALADERVIAHGDRRVTAGELRAAARVEERSLVRMLRGEARDNRRHLDYRRRVLALSLDRQRSIAEAEAALEALRARGGRVAEPVDDGRPVLRPIDDG